MIHLHVCSIAKTILRGLLYPLPLPEGVPSDRLALHWRLGWLKGLIFRVQQGLKELLGGTRFRCGRGLSIQGKLRLKGPGSVIFGDDVTIGDKTDIYTHSAQALVEIGSHCYLNGSRFGCEVGISVGSHSIIADARIMDTDFHSIYKERQSSQAPIRAARVAIGNNVWVAAGSAVLKGVRIGDNSIIGFGSVVTQNVPADRIAAGNPCREVCAVPSLFEKSGMNYDEREKSGAALA